MTGTGDGEVGQLVEGAIAALHGVNEAREQGLAACRRVIRSSGSAIRAAHRGRDDDAVRFASEAERALREAQDVLAPYPAVAFAGFLHDAEKEYAEARLASAFLGRRRVEGPDEIGVGVPAWLNGLAEAASELRRQVLDRLRAENLEEAEELLGRMDEAYDALVGVDFPDAVTGGLRRTTDALRAVLERTRSDLTLTAVQARLRASIERRFPEED